MESVQKCEAGCFMVLCLHLKSEIEFFSSVRPRPVSSEACLPVECLQTPGDSTQPPSVEMWKMVENSGNVTDCDSKASKPHKHMETWWNMSMFHHVSMSQVVLTGVDRCWPPVLHVFHISLHSIFDFLTRLLNTSPRSMRTDEERWGKMRVMENYGKSYGKFWKV